MFQAGNVVEHIVTGLRYLVSEVVDDEKILIMGPTDDDDTVAARLQLASDYRLATCSKEMAKEGKCSFVSDKKFVYVPNFCQYCEAQFLQKKLDGMH